MKLEEGKWKDKGEYVEVECKRRVTLTHGVARRIEWFEKPTSDSKGK